MAHQQLTEDDLKNIFKGSVRSRAGSFLSVINYILIFLCIFFVVYATINFNSLLNVISYWYTNDIKISDKYNSNLPETLISIKNGQEFDTSQTELPYVEEGHLLIPRINTDVPIIWQVKNDEKNIQDNLQKGVIHLDGTALPGQLGNTFITGHSSNYIWAKGNYKNVFALLSRLAVGDLIYLKYNNNIYIYKTDSIRTVKPQDLSVLNKTDGAATLSLMTCTPLGTSLNRLIVKADLIRPDSSSFPESTQSATLLPKGVR